MRNPVTKNMLKLKRTMKHRDRKNDYNRKEKHKKNKNLD